MAVTSPTLYRVSAHTGVNALAGAIAKRIRRGHECELQACGAGAVNQAVKALAVAATFLRDDGLAYGMEISFVDVRFDDGAERTAIRFAVWPM